VRKRINELAIPPAWRDVWICPWPNGHLQATGVDDAGRRQYLYHPDWQSSRARAKYSRIVGFGRSLPAARKVFNTDLALDGLPRRRVLAAAALMLDAGFFRIGSPLYAEKHGSVGLTTLQRRHVRRTGSTWVFRFVAKSGLRRTERIDEAELSRVIAALMRRRNGPGALFVYDDGSDRRALSADELNSYLKDALGDRYSAKDFRTWHGTVLAAVACALIDLDKPAQQRNRTATQRAVREVVVEVSERLGNTPAVCRRSYVDPRVIDAFESSRTIATTVRRHRRTAETEPDMMTALARLPSVERAVLAMLDG
jgi:DNA topoisomerase IB